MSFTGHHRSLPGLRPTVCSSSPPALVRPPKSVFPSENWEHCQTFPTGWLRGPGGRPVELAVQTPVGAAGGQSWRVSGWGRDGLSSWVSPCARVAERESPSSSLPPPLATALTPSWGPTLMTSSNPIYHLKAPSVNTILLVVRALIYKFWGDTFSP